MFKGGLEDLINDFQNSMRESLKTLLSLAIDGKPPSIDSLIKLGVDIAELKNLKSKTFELNSNVKCN